MYPLLLGIVPGQLPQYTEPLLHISIQGPGAFRFYIQPLLVRGPSGEGPGLLEGVIPRLSVTESVKYPCKVQKSNGKGRIEPDSFQQMPSGIIVVKLLETLPPLQKRVVGFHGGSCHLGNGTAT